MSSFDEIVSVTTRLRTAQLAVNIAANNRLRAMMDGYKPRPRTRSERVRDSINNFRCRVRDAWWVLTGKAEISYAEDE